MILCGSGSVSIKIFSLKMMMVGSYFVLCGVKQEPGRGRINPAIGIKCFVGSLTKTVVMHDANING